MQNWYPNGITCKALKKQKPQGSWKIYLLYLLKKNNQSNIAKQKIYNPKLLRGKVTEKTNRHDEQLNQEVG